MTISFFINRNDLEELDFLCKNCVQIAHGLNDKRIVNIEAFSNSPDLLGVKEVPLELLLSKFIQVTIDYDTYRLIKGYLMWQ